jgi:hypothetical protein
MINRVLHLLEQSREGWFLVREQPLQWFREFRRLEDTLHFQRQLFCGLLCLWFFDGSIEGNACWWLILLSPSLEPYPTACDVRATVKEWLLCSACISWVSAITIFTFVQNQVEVKLQYVYCCIEQKVSSGVFILSIFCPSTTVSVQSVQYSTGAVQTALYFLHVQQSTYGLWSRNSDKQYV